MSSIDAILDRYDLRDHVEAGVVIPAMPTSGLVLLVGASGSGKSTILRNWFGSVESPSYNHEELTIKNFTSIEAGERLLLSFGLRSIPTWIRPLKTLSNGEQHRALTALAVDQGFKYIDEFTSVVDRDTAKALSASIRKWHKGDLLVIATCHRDVEEWLCPDIIYDTDRCEFTARRFLRRPTITLEIGKGSFHDWRLFSKHHYLDDGVNKGCHFYVARIGQKPVAISAVIHGTCRDIKSYWRGSRLVVLPEFQGLGIGSALSDAIAKTYKDNGLRFFSKTAHVALGEYREKSPLWRPTSTNKKSRPSYLKDGVPRESGGGYGKTAKSKMRDSSRVCYSHEYVGENEWR